MPSATDAADTRRMEGINTRVVKLLVQPHRRTAFAVVEFAETAQRFPGAWQAVMQLRVALTVGEGDDIKSLSERACAEALAYFDQDCE